MLVILPCTSLCLYQPTEMAKVSNCETKMVFPAVIVGLMLPMVERNVSSCFSDYMLSLRHVYDSAGSCQANQSCKYCIVKMMVAMENLYLLLVYSEDFCDP